MAAIDVSRFGLSAFSDQGTRLSGDGLVRVAGLWSAVSAAPTKKKEARR